MAELKTKKTAGSVSAFLKTIPDPTKRKDAQAIIELMKKATHAEPKMWGSAIIGFGDTVLTYESGRQLQWFIMGFSPRKQNFALYIHGAVADKNGLLHKLGKYKNGKGCLYINKLEEVDMSILKKIIQKGLTS